MSPAPPGPAVHVDQPCGFFDCWHTRFSQKSRASPLCYLDSSSATFCSYDSLSLLYEGGIGLLALTGFKFWLFMLPLELNRISVVEKSVPLFLRDSMPWLMTSKWMKTFTYVIVQRRADGGEGAFSRNSVGRRILLWAYKSSMTHGLQS